MDLTGNTQDIQLQTDGKIIAKGSFTELNRTNVNRIVRLNVDGSLDTTFNPKIDALATQQDGKIIIGGKFSNYNGTNRSRVARINSDGSLDATFEVGYGANNEVTLVTLQPDGKISIKGYSQDMVM